LSSSSENWSTEKLEFLACPVLCLASLPFTYNTFYVLLPRRGFRVLLVQTRAFVTEKSCPKMKKIIPGDSRSKKKTRFSVNFTPMSRKKTRLSISLACSLHPMVTFSSAKPPSSPESAFFLQSERRNRFFPACEALHWFLRALWASPESSFFFM